VFIVGAGNESTWLSLCDALQRQDLAEDERFATNPLRVKNREALVAILTEIFATQPAEYWVALLEASGCPATRVLNVAEAFQSRHAQERGMVLEVASPAGDELLPTIGFPYTLCQEPPRAYRRPPGVGEHSREVLAQFTGLNEEELGELVRTGIIGEPVAAEPACPQ
jgi:formyl-CoA transferase